MDEAYYEESKAGGGFSVSRAGSPLRYLDFTFKKIKSGESFLVIFPRQECLITLLAGKISLEIDTTRVPVLRVRKKRPLILGPRKDVFSGAAHAFYLAAGQRALITGLLDSELILSRAPARKALCSFPIKPQQVSKRWVGQRSCRRQVHDILKESDPAVALLAGETYNQPGKWSSYPPHKHDKADWPMQTKLEEIYFFKLKPANRFALMRVYGNYRGRNFERVLTIRHNSCVIIPRGYHPVVALPDTKLYYFWVLAGNRRNLRHTTDPIFL